MEKVLAFMAKALDDTFLLTQLQDGNDQAIEILYSRYAEGLYGYAVRNYHLSPEDAADAVQTTFSSLIEKIHTYDEDRGAGRQWIYAIFYHTIIDTLRRKKLQAGQVGIQDIDLPSEPYSLEERLIQREWSEAVKRAWNQLSEGDQRELRRGRGRGPGRKVWHEAAQRFRALLSSQEHPNDD